MATKHTLHTDVYEELFELLKVAREAGYPWRGKKMSHDIWLYYMKEIVDEDIKMGEMDTNRMRRDIASLDATNAENHAQLWQIQVKFKELEWDALFNGIKIKKAIEHADRLKTTLMACYMD